LFSKTEILSKLHAVSVPSGSINSVEEALNDEQAVHRQIVYEINGISAIRSPILFDTFSLNYNHLSPKLGQHTSEIKEKLNSNMLWGKEVEI
jgi:crotonobetainyl-CoA:carnitine CoA-transferase CaiB-like acyl-CoA transferase